MRSQHLKMSLDEFHRLPRHPGWTYEYFGGQAHIRPAHAIAVVSMPLSPRPVAPPCPLRAVEAADAETLIDAFAEAFEDAAEYCDWKPEDVRASGWDCVESFFAGRRGAPMAASRLAEADDGVAGAALVVRSSAGPWLDMLFVRPAWHRRGLGTALVGAAVNELLAAGETHLASGYHIANDASRAWHLGFGFTHEPDLPLAERALRHAKSELRRRDKIGDLNPPERAVLQAEIDRCKTEVEALEALARTEGYERVCPLLRYRDE